MKRILPLVALVMPLGCQHNPNTFGWRFECGRGGAVATYSIVNPTATAYMPAGLCAGPAAGPLVPTMAGPPLTPTFSYTAPPAASGPCGAPPSVTPAELMEEVRRLRRSLQQAAPPPPPAQMLPMPRGCSITQTVLAMTALDGWEE